MRSFYHDDKAAIELFLALVRGLRPVFFSSHLRLPVLSCGATGVTLEHG